MIRGEGSLIEGVRGVNYRGGEGVTMRVIRVGGGGGRHL